ncbi:MAG: ComF family protein [Verrucomicrobiae bacterium]|nr:ComF family protein [Verrucomicrobiae bacterium]
MAKKLEILWEPIVDLFFPRPQVREGCYVLQAPFCDCCGQPFACAEISGWACSNCASMVCYFDRARAFYLSRGSVREVIHHFKYESRFWLRVALMEWLEEGFFRFFKDSHYQALVPVPLFGRRKRWRGFNQAEILAQELAKSVKLPVWNCLRRIRETETQTHLDRRERQKNVHNAFRLAKGYEVRDNDYLMIDDVFTTGSTVNECARVLKEHGARKVDVLTIARG